MSDIDNTSQEQPQYVTAKDLNGALTAYKKDMQRMLEKQAEQQKELIETLNRNLGPKPETPPLPSKAEIADDTAELKKQLRILMERDRQRDEQEKQMKLTNSLRDNLNKVGIKTRDDLAIKYLKDQVSYDEEGQLVMKFDEIQLPLHEAVAKFAQTDHGKFLADPRDVRGSGSAHTTGQNRVMPGMPGMPQPAALQPDGTPIFKDLASLKAVAESITAKHNLNR